MVYSSISITRFVSAKETVQYTPETKTSMAKYKGEVVVTVQVEGNICTADPATLGTLIVTEEGMPIVKLVVGSPVSSELQICAQYSKGSEVSFSIPIYRYETGRAIDEVLGVVRSHDFFTGKPELKEIRFQAYGGVSTLVVSDL